LDPQKRYLRSISFSLVASVLSKVAGGFSSFIVAKSLEPANYGIWLTMTLFVSYSSILSLGTVETLLKQVPFYKGKGELQAARRLEEVIYTAVLMAAVAVLVVGFLAAILVERAQIESIFPAVLVMVVAASVSFPSAFYYYRFVAHQDFKTVGIIETLRAFFNLFLVVGLSYVWGLAGAALGFCLTEMIVCLMSGVASWRNHGRMQLAFDFRSMWDSVLIGFPIMIFWWISMLQGSVDRLVSISLLGKVSTGYYGIGIAIVSVILLLPQSISRVFYPRINEKYGETSRADDLFRIVILPTRIMGLTLAGGIGVAVVIMPFVFHLLPKYLPGLAATQILLAISYFRFSVANGVNFLIATNRQSRLILLVLASLCVGVAAAYGAVKLGLGIEGLAASTCLSGLFLTLAVWQSVFVGMGFGSLRRWEEISKLYVPLMVMLVLLGAGLLVIPQFLKQASVFSIVYAMVYAATYAGVVLALPLTRHWTTEMLSIVFRARAPKAS
jgi:O-antigen/teichoic acid export membrane protein